MKTELKLYLFLRDWRTFAEITEHLGVTRRQAGRLVANLNVPLKRRQRNMPDRMGRNPDEMRIERV